VCSACRRRSESSTDKQKGKGKGKEGGKEKRKEKDTDEDSWRYRSRRHWPSLGHIQIFAKMDKIVSRWAAGMACTFFSLSPRMSGVLSCVSDYRPFLSSLSTCTLGHIYLVHNARPIRPTHATTSHMSPRTDYGHYAHRCITHGIHRRPDPQPNRFIPPPNRARVEPNPRRQSRPSAIPPRDGIYVQWTRRWVLFLPLFHMHSC